MSSDPNYTDSGLSPTLTGQITVAAVILIFVTFILILILYLRAKGYSGTTGSFHSRRLVFSPHQPTIPRLALHPSILISLPITVFQSKEFDAEDSCLECAVCLCELSDGEHVRILPKCKHGFHVECIDMWFHSNNTCPLCRNLVVCSDQTNVADTQLSAVETLPVEDTVIEAGSSSASTRKRKEGVFVIDIPTRIAGAFSSGNTPMASSKVPSNSPLPTSRLLEEVTSPVVGRMRSFKRMLSRGSTFKGVGTSYGSLGHDIEQGGSVGVETKCQ